MRKSLSLILVISLIAPTTLIISEEASAPLPNEVDIPGPHLMNPNPDFYPTLPFPQNPPILGSYSRTRDPLTNDLLVLLIEFPDRAHNAANTPTAINTKMNGNSQGNLRHYFNEVSYGQYQVQATIGGNQWFQSSLRMIYYGTDSATGVDDANGPIYELIRETVQLADAAGVDFSNYDQDSDGVVDHLMVIHAGDGQESALNTNLIWSHRWAVVNPSLYVDGVQVYTYTLISESSPIGVIAHEFGHDLGLPDLYDTDDSSKGAGIWDIMATGSWAGLPKGTMPAHLSAWSKSKLGWITPIEVNAPRYSVQIQEVETYPVAFKLPVKSSTPEEYFLVENRENVGYDVSMPGQGLLIWHIDESVTSNDDDWHRMVDLEEADSVGGDNPEEAGDTWTSNNIGFTPDSVPNSNGYGNFRTGWKVRNIGAANATMTADISREVDDDLAVIDVESAKSVAVNTIVTFGLEVANLGARNQTNIPILISVYLEKLNSGQMLHSDNRSLNIQAKTHVNFTWSYRPQTQGRHLIKVEAFLSTDEIPENNYKLTHFNAISAYFFDDVESGNKGWTISPTGEQYQWQIVQQGGYAGDAMSPTHSWRFGYFSATGGVSPLYSIESQSISYQAGLLYLTFFHSYKLAVPSEVPVNNTDEANVKISINGGPWIQVPGGRFNQTQLRWKLFYANLSSYSSSPGTIRLRFESTAGYMPVDGGWWIDDIFVSSYRFGPAVGLLPIITALTVEPGEQASFIFKLVNLGDFSDSFRLFVTSDVAWTVALSYNNSPPVVPSSVTVSLGPDRDEIMTFIVHTPEDAVRGSVASFNLTTRSETDSSIRDYFDTTVTINDPWGLAQLGRYIILFIIVFVVLIVIAFIIDSIKRRRGIQ